MPKDTSMQRRAFLASAIASSAASFLLAQEGQAQPSARRAEAVPPPSFGTLKRVQTSLLDISYADIGPADGRPVLLLHGWPYDIHTYVDVAPILARAGYRVIVPYLRGYGATRFISDATSRNGQQAALAADALELIDALGIKEVVVGGCDWGARTANILAVLRPDRVRALVSVSGYLIVSQAANAKPLSPEAEQRWWYQFYFATKRGQEGYAANTHAFARLIWQTASPRWAFDDGTFARSAAALDNPDHVDIAIHNYRWRLGLAEGEAHYDSIERKLATFPPIRIPAITLEGDANGAPHPLPEQYRSKFEGAYQHRLIEGGIGHNLPQEAPVAFARAIVDADRLASGEPSV